ncbi:hypothetical protein B0J13DRAFT_441022 [Dactylonectria estremocensis]|uniref:C3H1-type domain-containing protein n=1 Tax=Dactylonectria estremocensis TaxID=1079267 RepID=A0A9P9F081_9HYPO|nr:hypothetical protein B0J13DRAFT_441022 [Dactylonectria estremocensis]
MQSWSNNGQTGADEQSHQHQWQANYSYADQNGQFDPHQPWSQPMTDQTAYSHINPQDASSNNFFDSPGQANSFLSGNLHGSPPPTQPGFHAGHDSLALNQQFSQTAQDVLDPAFSDIHSDLYGQQGKMNLGNSMSHLNQVQNHSHSHNQGFQYSFAPQNEQSYESPIQQYAQPHVIPQQSRQQSHTPVQQFEGLQAPNFAHGHGYTRPPQQSPVPNQQQPYTNSAFSPPLNGQTTQPPTNAQHSYQQPRQQPLQQQQQQQQGYSQPSAPAQFVAQKASPYQQPAHNVANQNFHQSIQQQPRPFAASSSPPPATSAQYIMPHQPVEVDSPASQSAAIEPTAKKRKRTAAKGAPEAHTPEPMVAIDSPMDYGVVPGSTPTKKVDEVESLVAPIPSPEDAQLMAQFNKRSKALQAKQPAIKGLPHLLYDDSMKLPAPKSYDKLAPLVAHPSQSGKAMVAELGYSLPCEVQGRFTSQYRPSPDKGGLDERRIEAKELLDEFDHSMKALGKRRPKYTEYPHAFKEQLKSDEASKNKAEKKAKREMEEERNKPVRSATRPTHPAEAAAWDVTGLVHIDQSTARTTALIASRVQQAGEFIIKLRGEMNRAKQELDQGVKDKDPETAIAKVRQDFEQKKDVLYRVLDATIEHADDAVIDNMGGHQKLVLSLVNALIMCIKAGDYSGKFPKIVLELFTHFPMSKKISDTTNFDTVRKRFADKGDEEVKELLRDISAKLKKALKAESDSTGYTGTSAASRAKAATKDHSTAKRGRDDESDTRVVKKIAVESSGNSLSKKLAQPNIQLQSASKTTAAKAAAASILPGKTRPVAKPAPKPETAKADARVTGEDRLKADTKAPTKTETKVPLPKTVSSTSSALSGIASLLDSINAPKAEPLIIAPKEDKTPDTSETPEERTKRLRKEARRKLRVTWKSEGELVQVKIFQKEEAEDEGREVHMIRDAGDDRSEGMVLKQRANVEDEDDDDDIPYQPWVEPIATNFSNLSSETQNKNFVTRGGNVTFTTDEQQRIKEREQRELMAIYTDPDDIPPTPKSPPLEPVGAADWKTHHLPSEDPKFQEIRHRWRDERQMGVDRALYAATKRLDAKNNPSNKLDSILGRLRGVPTASQAPTQQPTLSQQSSSPTHDSLPVILGGAVEEQVLTLLRSGRTKTWRDSNPSHSNVWRAHHYSDPSVYLCGNAVELAARPLVGKPFPASSPPEWILHDQEKVREWQLGYSREVASRQKAAAEGLANAETAGNHLAVAAANTLGGQAPGDPTKLLAYYSQQQAYAPYMALLQQMNGGQQSGQPQPAAASAQQLQIPDSQLQSILAAINQPSQPAQATGSNQANYLNPNDPSYQQFMMITQMAQGQQPTPPPPAPAGDRDWERERGEDQGGRGEQRDGKGRKRGTLPPHKPANKALIGTKPCTFWQQGKCARGDKCTFRHD